MVCIMNYQPEHRERPVIRRGKSQPKCWRVKTRKAVSMAKVVW